MSFEARVAESVAALASIAAVVVEVESGTKGPRLGKSVASEALIAESAVASLAASISLEAESVPTLPLVTSVSSSAKLAAAVASVAESVVDVASFSASLAALDLEVKLVLSEPLVAK